MRKEVFFAIVAGISIGLVIAFGSWKIARSFKKASNVIDVNKNTPPQKVLGLTISNLYDYDVVTTDPFVITGSGTPLSDVVVSTTDEDFYTSIKEDGSFEIEVSFPAGLSEVKLNDKKLKVVYSTEFDETIVETEDNSATTIPDTIRERVKKDIAYTGTITDISAGTIQIKSLEGDIKQMSLNDNTTLINTLKKNVEIKSTDLAIGDFIVAMGFVNGGKVLDTKRVLVTDAFKENPYEVIVGNIDLLSKTKLTIRTNNGDSEEITLPKKWIGPNVSELSENQKIIVVGMFENEIYTLRTVFTPIE